jgi:hypothetical protein
MTTTRAATRLMLVLAATAAMTLAFAPAADAKPKGSGAGTCSCICDGGPNGSQVTSYNAVAGASCDAFNGKTCNFENPQQQIRSGTVSLCQAGDSPAGATGPTGGHAGMSMAPPKSNGPPPKNSGSPDHPDASTGAPAKATP